MPLVLLVLLSPSAPGGGIKAALAAHERLNTVEGEGEEGEAPDILADDVSPTRPSWEGGGMAWAVVY